jgi:hypothetical protein
MESAAMCAHGAAFMLQERFRELSDAFKICVCGACGLLSDDICMEINYAYCRGCLSNTNIRSVMVPFTFLVMSLELMSTGVSTHFHTKDDKESMHAAEYLPSWKVKGEEDEDEDEDEDEEEDDGQMRDIEEEEEEEEEQEDDFMRD